MVTEFMELKTQANNRDFLDSCDLCSGAEFKTLFVKEGFPHVRCSSCGLVFVNPRLKNQWDIQLAGGTGSMNEDALTPRQERRLASEVRMLQKYRRLNRFLEIGPGKGWFLKEAKAQGWETWASEINSDSLARLKQIQVDQIHVGPAENLTVPEDHFDVIRMWDVIEHLRSPKAAIDIVFNALRPGGIIRTATTNFASLSRWVNGPEWIYLNGSDHIFLFEPLTISELLIRAGFRSIKIKTKSFNLKRKLYHPNRSLPANPFLIPFRKMIDECIRLTPYGHQMIVVAEKPISS